MVFNSNLDDVALSNETSIKSLPEWLRNNYFDLDARLSRKSSREFGNFIEQLFLTKELISKLPEQTVLYELYQLKPDKLKILFQSGHAALVHSCEAVLGFWIFQHAYKFKSFFDGFNYAITEGNFLLAFSCARAMFEEVAHFHFFLVRIEASHEKAAHLWAQAVHAFGEENHLRKIGAKTS